MEFINYKKNNSTYIYSFEKIYLSEKYTILIKSNMYISEIGEVENYLKVDKNFVYENSFYESEESVFLPVAEYSLFSLINELMSNNEGVNVVLDKDNDKLIFFKYKESFAKFMNSENLSDDEMIVDIHKLTIMDNVELARKKTPNLKIVKKSTN